MKFFSKALAPQPAGEDQPKYVLSLTRVSAKDMVKFLRPLPLQGRVYLLVSDGRVQERYTLQSSLEVLRLTFGQYQVYEIDVRPAVLNFVLPDVAMAGTSQNVVRVSVDADLKVYDAQALFNSNIHDIKETTQRRITNEIEDICRLHVPTHWREAETRILEVLRGKRFDFGVEIETVRVHLQLSQAIETKIAEGGLPPDELSGWTGGRVEFQADFTFFERPDIKYIAQVSLRAVADGEPSVYQEKLRLHGVRDPLDETKHEARTIILDTLRTFTGKSQTNLTQAESEATNQLLNKVFPFGVRITSASVNIVPPEEVIKEIREGILIEKIHAKITKALAGGPVGLLAAIASDHSIRENLQELFRGLREQQRYEIDIRNEERDRVLGDLEKLVNSKNPLIDPEVHAHRLGEGLVDAVKYLLTPNASQPQSGAMLTSGAVSSTPRSARGDMDVVVDAKGTRHDTRSMMPFDHPKAYDGETSDEEDESDK